MEPHTAPPGKAWGLGQGPFVLSGTPPVITGEIELVNHSTEKVKVRSMAARATSAAQKAGAPETLGTLRMAARLEPGRRERVAAHLLVAPDTPPGRYEADLQAGEERARVVVHVLERQEVLLQPYVIALRGAPGDALSHVLVVTNRGNVTHMLPLVVLVHLEEVAWFGRSLVYALREMQEGEGHQAYLDRVIREMKATDVAPMRVEVSAKDQELPPGATTEATLQLIVPEKLIKGRTYRRTIPFMGSRLTFRIECNGSVQSSKRRAR